jgi:hypothetical protein
MDQPSAEIDRAVSALATELIKLTPLEGVARDTLCVTVESALSRLVLAILAHSNDSPEKLMPASAPEHSPPILTGPI